MFVLLRAITYGSVFIFVLLIFLPEQILSRYGVIRPADWGALELMALGVGILGGGLAIWCILTFVFVGKGTPAPFDPPRRLVVAGPYRYVRNPMYLGAFLAVLAAALFYRSLALAGYAAAFLLVTHLFVVLYEEPTLTRTFGSEYQNYRIAVGRWLPRFREAA
jgi:protein-S-isoprenylcysteine O-methyltransferase Ste14